MNDKKHGQADRIQRYARLIEKQAGRAVRPYRADGYMNMVNRYGTSKDSHEHYQFVAEPAIPDTTLCDFYEGNGLFAKIIDAPAEEAMKHGFKLGDVSDEEVETFYQEALDELDWVETCMTALKWARLFGGSIVVMLINDGGGLEDPLNWRKVKSIDDLRVYDRSVVEPVYSTMFSYDPRDPFRTRGSRLGMPEFYHVNSRFGTFTVHESRCLVFQNGVLPENSSNSIYQFWGMPEYIRLKKAIRDSELAHGAAPRMLDRSVQPVYKMKDLASLLATEEGESQVLRRLQVIDLARGLLNSLVIDSEGEDYDFKSFQFTGVSDVVDTCCNFLSALTNIPQTILFGRSPAGMNSTGESDFENWYSFVDRIRSRMVKGNLRYLLCVIFQAGLATGEVDEVPKIKIEFNPLWSLTELEQADLDLKRAQTQQAKAQTIHTYVQMEAIDPREVRRKLADSGEFDIDTILDEYEDEEELMAAYAGQEVAPGFDPGIMESGDLAQYGTGVDVDAHRAEPGKPGSAPANAPDATKLPQDMNPEDQEKAAQNTDSAPFGVGVLVVRDGKILTGSRHNDTGYGLICGPGGHGEKGETPAQAAFRETEEEFGISPKELIPIGIGPFEPESGLRSHIFLCTEFEGEPDCVDLEMTNPRFRTLEELNELAPSLFPPFADSLGILSSCLEHTDSHVSSGGGRLDEDWITVNGTHIPLDDDGTAMGGGKLKGKNFSRAKSEKSKPKSSGKSGGSKAKATELSKSIKDAFASEDYDEIESAVSKAMEDMPVGSTMSVNGTTIRKKSDGQFEAEDPWGGKAPTTPDEISDSIANWEDEDIDIEFKIPDNGSSSGDTPSTKPASPKDIRSQADLRNMSDADRMQLIKDIETENPRYWLQGNGTMENYIASEYGLNKPPEVLEGAEFDRYVRETGSTMMWRGVRDYLSEEDDELLVSAAEMEQEFATENKSTYGGGNFGSGYHFATNKKTAEGFGSSTSEQEGRVFTCALKPNARVVPHDRAKREAERLGISQSLWALLNGYDAISSDTGVYNVLNRGALVMKKPS